MEGEELRDALPATGSPGKENESDSGLVLSRRRSAPLTGDLRPRQEERSGLHLKWVNAAGRGGEAMGEAREGREGGDEDKLEVLMDGIRGN